MSSKNSTKQKKSQAVSIQNRKAFHDFIIDEKFECGIALKGTEVKSIRSGQAQLRDSFAKIEKGELWLYNCNISPYQYGNRFNHEPLRKRKLLLHSKEILKLYQKIKEKQFLLIPLKIYFSGNWAKIEIGLGKGKKVYDKRESMKKKEIEKTIKEVKGKYI